MYYVITTTCLSPQHILISALPMCIYIYTVHASRKMFILQGAPGPTGTRGAPGHQGDNGANGANGNPGPAGANGVGGTQGPRGSTGQKVYYQLVCVFPTCTVMCISVASFFSRSTYVFSDVPVTVLISAASTGSDGSPRAIWCTWHSGTDRRAWRFWPSRSAWSKGRSRNRRRQRRTWG